MGACVLHLALFAAFRGRSAPPAPANVAQTTIDIAVDEQLQAPTPDATLVDRERAEAANAKATRASGHASTSPSVDSVAPPSASALASEAPIDVLHVDPQAGQAPWSFRTTQGGVDLGIGDKSGSLARQMLANGQLEMPREPLPRGPPAPPPPVSPGVKMIQELDASDVARGFGRGGPVVQAIEAVVRDARPSEGAATFEVAIAKSGEISVRVLEAATHREEWEGLSSAIAALVKTKHIRFPEKALGLRFGIRVATSNFSDGKGQGGSGFGDPSALTQPSDRDDGATQTGNLRRGGGLPIGGGFPTGGSHETGSVHAREIYEQRM